jgi:prephenate dehydrogenase
VRTASGLGAGRPRRPEDRPQLVVVAVPPDHLGEVIAAALAASDAVVTDVGSVKSAPLAAVLGRPGADRYVGSHPMAGSEQTGPLAAVADVAGIERYVGGHPMAGSERSGPLAATAALFDGRTWAVTPHEGADPAAVDLVTALALACGATPVRLSPDEHDQAVARTSHLPHLLAAMAAGRLAEAPAEHLALSGQGVRDVTRIAAGDPQLWQQILTANTAALTALLRDVRDDVDTLLGALTDGDRVRLAGVLDRGVAGTAAIPGKHGGPAVTETTLFVAVPDHPGELARLLADAGEIGVNVEDLRIDHDPGRDYGQVELTVDPGQVDHLLSSLEDRGWTTHR